MGAADVEEKHISSEELRLHNSRTDLWISIQGKVYDVTNWAKAHPGGDVPLLSLAGQDVTDAFIAYHPGSAWAHLDRFFIGRLTDYRVSEVSRDFRRLAAEFSKSGLFEKKDHLALYTLVSIAVLLVAAVYGVLGSDSTLVHLLSGGLIGLLWTQSGWVGHDSGHYRAMTTARLNRLVQILTGNCLAGVSMAWWKWTHNGHHIACNSLEFDPNIQLMPVFAVSPKLFESLRSYFFETEMNFDAISRFLVSYQHWTFYPVMCLARIDLFVQTVILLANKKVPNRKQEVVGIVFFWIWYPLLISCLPNWGERVMFMAANFSVIGIQHIQFCLSHFSSSVYLGRPAGNDWFEKQTVGTLNITCSPSMDWFHGGLQFQIEHHLFPRLPRCNLRKISPLVRELCDKHKLSYSAASFWEANVRTIAALRAAAMQARDWSKPVPRNLVWEAVKTHG